MPGMFQPSFNYVTPSGATQITTYVSAATGYAAPPGAVAFLLQTDSTNTANVNWRLGTVAAGASVGHLLEPGRDTGIITYGATVSVCPVSGPTQIIQLTWFTA